MTEYSLSRIPNRRALMMAGGAAAAIASLSLAACGGDNPEQARATPVAIATPATETATPSAAETPTPSATASPKKYVLQELVFDALGGTPEDIGVYPGYTENLADKVVYNTYNDKDKVIVECKVTGREVQSHPEPGRNEKEVPPSDLWARLPAVPGKPPLYASFVYTANRSELEKNLIEC